MGCSMTEGSAIKITKAMHEWCCILSAGGYIKGWIGSNIGCSAQNQHGCGIQMRYTMVEKLLDAGLIEWEEYEFAPSMRRKRAVLTPAGHREAAAK